MTLIAVKVIKKEHKIIILIIIYQIAICVGISTINRIDYNCKIMSNIVTLGSPHDN